MITDSRRFLFASAVHIFLWGENDQLLMSRRCNTGYEDGNYSLVAGHLEGGETIVAAAAREAKEEVGISIALPDVEIVGVIHRRTEGDERIDFFVTVRRWEGQITNMEPDRCDDLRWVAPENPPENTVPYIRLAIENYMRGSWFGTMGF